MSNRINGANGNSSRKAFWVGAVAAATLFIPGGAQAAQHHRVSSVIEALRIRNWSVTKTSPGILDKVLILADAKCTFTQNCSGCTHQQTCASND